MHSIRLEVTLYLSYDFISKHCYVLHTKLIEASTCRDSECQSETMTVWAMKMAERTKKRSKTKQSLKKK